jgi:hypothetical protein
MSARAQAYAHAHAHAHAHTRERSGEHVSQAVLRATVSVLFVCDEFPAFTLQRSGKVFKKEGGNAKKKMPRPGYLSDLGGKSVVTEHSRVANIFKSS